MNTLKFRVWDKETNSFVTIGNMNSLFSSSENVVFFNRADRYIAQQFIGLLDKTGKEIYEGDIIVSQINAKHFPIEYKEVIFSDGRFAYRYQSSHWADTFTEDLNEESINTFRFKIIGNIFETPELLNK